MPAPAAPPPQKPAPAPAPAPPIVAAGGRRHRAAHVAYTHPGGSKPPTATNQDVYFAYKLDECNQVFGVLDGHGGDNGAFVASVAARTIERFIARNFDRLRTEPEGVLTDAFELAHATVRTELLAAQAS